MSPSPTTDPRERSTSEFPASAPPREPSKTYGQDYQYAETLQNPFPEVILSSAANTGQNGAPTSHIGAADGANEPDTRSSLRPDTAGSKEPAMHEDIWVEPREVPWYKTISRRKWATIIISTLGITGVMLAILGAMNKFSPPRTSNPSPPTDDNASTTTGTVSTASSSSTTTSSTTNPTSTSQPPKIECNTPSTFLTHITWIGTQVGAYRGEFAQASSASACCASCLTHHSSGSSGGGCAGWLYNATSTFTPCTKIIVVASSSSSGKDGETDDKCPKGYAETTYFARGDGDGDGDGVAGMGPCSGKMQVQ
ncbi:hypothetical protein C8A00DRAFT_30340 [Chaetomidium leptoderma]|uniref:Uncharacterized protein n=1 Tax=Chaetomidium leptoderma TaxID=669021 RepID=A0AAN6VSV4_9PEZI|nr:hypothetical protein C8A00DRAFT_30340 [Chaetomidium leptoderma]